MTQIKHFLVKFLKGFFKTALIIFLFLFLLLFSAIVAIQFPSVQTKAVNKATSYLSKELNHPISIQSIDISWFDRIKINGLSVEDRFMNEMIFVQEAFINFELGTLTEPDFHLQEITLKNGQVKVIRFSPEGEINITELVESIQNLGGEISDSDVSIPFLVEKVKLHNMQFTYFDQRKVLDKVGFDCNHFIIDSIYSDINNLKVHKDTFAISVNSLSGFEKQSKLRIHDLKSEYLITKSKMEFSALDAHIGNSHLKDYLLFEYKDILDLSEFNELIDVTAYARKSSISMHDLTNFIPLLKPYKDKALLSGNFKGRVDRFSVHDLDLAFGKNSHIKGEASFDGLPDIEETFIDFKFHKSQVDVNDLKQYATNNSWPVLKKFGEISGSGEFIGFPNDFVASGNFNSALGQINSDINLKINQNQHRLTSYSGNLETFSFNLGELIESPYTGKIDMKGSIKGAGFTLSDAEVNLNAEISKIDLYNYTYNNIVTNAKLSNRLFNGDISVKDTNLSFHANGKVDLRENSNIFNIKAEFDKANLKPLGFSEVETLVKTKLDLNFKGLDPDDIIGSAQFTNTYLLYLGNKEIFIDYLYAQSMKNKEGRSLNIFSDLVTAHAKGNFEISRLLSDAEALYKEYLLDLKNDQQEISEYYKAKNTSELSEYALEFDVNVKNLNALLSIYVPGLYLSKNFKINGNYTSGNTSILNFHTEFDTLHYQENEIHNANLDISTSKLADSSAVLGMFYLSSQNQKFYKLPKTRDLQLEGIWNNRNIKFFTRVFQEDSTNNLLLNGNLSLEENQKLQLTLKNSSFNLLQKDWTISDHTEVIIENKDITFNNLSIFNDLQVLSLNGTFSDDDASQSAILSVGNFQLETLNPLLEGFNLKGVMDGKIVFKDIFRNLNINSNTYIKDLVLENISIGNVSGYSAYDYKNGRLTLDLDVERLAETVVKLKGYIQENEKSGEQEANLTAYLNNTNLQLLNPVLKGFASDISGKVAGTFKITGPLKSMKYNGKADIQNGKFKVDYLGTTYSFDDYIYFDDNLIGFKSLKLKDGLGNISYLDGGLYHDNFSNFVVNLKTRLNQLQVFELEEEQNDMFYGTAFMTGNMEMLGTFENLEINANATTNRGTKIYIPLNQTNSVVKQEFISFKSKKTLGDTVSGKEIDLSGIKLDFNLDVTPDAYMEIIFDKRTGDIIRGNGEGNIKMDIDTRGDFHLYGNYKMTKGAYNFTLAGLINKEFTIHPGSSITWTGDPYGGILDIKASYDQYVSLRNILISLDSATAKAEGLRKYPVKTILDVSGNLEAPDIGLDIKISGYPNNLAQDVTAFEAEIQTNKNELNRQVFSLLMLRNFSPKNSFTGQPSYGEGNLSELLMHQLSAWLSQVDENLQIDLDLNSMNLEELNTFQLRMSYTMLDGRLRISRDGNVSSVQQPESENNLNNISNIAGEWTIEYLISDDGKFRLKLYNRNNTNQLLTSLTNTNTTTAGASILHTQSFDNLRELIMNKKRRSKNLSKSSEEEFLNKLNEFQKRVEEKIKEQENNSEKGHKEDKQSLPEDLFKPNFSPIKKEEEDESENGL